MSKNNNALLLIGGAIALYYFASKQKDGEGLTLDISPFIGGEGGGGLFDFTGIGDLFSNLGTGLGNLFSGIQFPDFSGLQFPDIFPPATPDNGGAGGGGDGSGNPPPPTGFWDTQYITPTGSGIVDFGNVVSQSAMALGKGALLVGGSYVGSKFLSPIVSQVGSKTAPVIAQGARNIISGGNSAMSWLGRAMVSPVSKVPLAATVPLVIGAGVGGYAIGSAFNKTAAGKALIEKSGQAGAAFSQTSVGKMIWQQAQPRATTTKSGYTSAQIKDMVSSGMSVSDIKRKLGI